MTTNPKVYLDITAAGSPLGRILIELCEDVAPKTTGFIIIIIILILFIK